MRSIGLPEAVGGERLTALAEPATGRQVLTRLYAGRAGVHLQVYPKSAVARSACHASRALENKTFAR